MGNVLGIRETKEFGSSGDSIFWVDASPLMLKSVMEAEPLSLPLGTVGMFAFVLSR